MLSINDGLSKAPTGIQGLDEITGGGLPRGRPTLVCGHTGVGKTLLALEFLFNGATHFGEGGVFITFEESATELCVNVASFGFDLCELIKQEKLDIDHIHLNHTEVSGGYDLDGMFIRLESAIKKVNAKRVAIDSVDLLFLTLQNPVLMREEIRRMMRWLKERNLTVIVTGESGPDSLTRNGMEEYVSDCVIVLENRVTHQNTTRLLRIVKYRGSMHGGNEYPFLIGEEGISVLPITSLSLDVIASTERVSTGTPELDAMLGGHGYYRGSAIMVSGPPGSGKSIFAAKFAQSCCERGERCLYFLLEESRSQIIRNFRSVGINLQPLLDQGVLEFVMTRPTLHGLERHLAKFQQAILKFQPRVVVFDPISALHNLENTPALKSMLLRLVNFLKAHQITSHFVALTNQSASLQSSEIGLSSLIDSWVQLRDVENNGERNRVVQVLKSRGMAHSNQMREFRFSEDGIALTDIYVGSDGVLTGSARLAQQAEEEFAKLTHQQEAEHRIIELENMRRLKDTRIAALEAEFANREAEVQRLTEIDRQRELYHRELGRKILKNRQLDNFPDAEASAAESSNNDYLS